MNTGFGSQNLELDALQTVPLTWGITLDKLFYLRLCFLIPKMDIKVPTLALSDKNTTQITSCHLKFSSSRFNKVKRNR